MAKHEAEQFIQCLAREPTGPERILIEHIVILDVRIRTLRASGRQAEAGLDTKARTVAETPVTTELRGQPVPNGESCDSRLPVGSEASLAELAAARRALDRGPRPGCQSHDQRKPLTKAKKTALRLEMMIKAGASTKPTRGPPTALSRSSRMKEAVHNRNPSMDKEWIELVRAEVDRLKLEFDLDLYAREANEAEALGLPPRSGTGPRQCGVRSPRCTPVTMHTGLLRLIDI